MRVRCCLAWLKPVHLQVYPVLPSLYIAGHVVNRRGMEPLGVARLPVMASIPGFYHVFHPAVCTFLQELSKLTCLQWHYSRACSVHVLLPLMKLFAATWLCPDIVLCRCIDNHCAIQVKSRTDEALSNLGKTGTCAVCLRISALHRDGARGGERRDDSSHRHASRY